MDEHLLSIVQAAERGLDCPPVRVLTAGYVIWGAPGRSADFLELSADPLLEQYEGFAAEQKEGYVDPQALAQEHLGNVRWPSVGDAETTVLTLLDAYVWPVAGSEGLTLPAVRVPVENVQAWWIAGDKPLRAPG